MDIQEVMKRSDKINGNPLPNTFILHAMVGENKSFEEQIERIAIQIYQSQELHLNEISEALERDNFMTADEAMKFGLIDSVVEKRK